MLNKVQIIGNLGKDPELYNMANGKIVVNLSIASSESWKDKNTGDRVTKSEWHKVVIFTEGLANIATEYLTKGSKVFIEGKLQTRDWTGNDGVKKYITEIIMNGFDSKLIMLDDKTARKENSYSQNNAFEGVDGPAKLDDTQEFIPDEIPF